MCQLYRGRRLLDCRNLCHSQGRTPRLSARRPGLSTTRTPADSAHGTPSTTRDSLKNKKTENRFFAFSPKAPRGLIFCPFPEQKHIQYSTVGGTRSKWINVIVAENLNHAKCRRNNLNYANPASTVCKSSAIYCMRFVVNSINNSETLIIYNNSFISITQFVQNIQGCKNNKENK